MHVQSRKSILRSAVALSALWSAVAQAEDPNLQKLQAAIERLESAHRAEIQALQAEIDQLKKKQAATEQQVQAQAPTADRPVLVESPTHQFGLTSPDGSNSIALIARFQFDGGDYLNVAPQGGPKGAGAGGAAGPLDSGVNARRARLGIGGTFINDWSYRLIYDFGSSADSVTTGVSGAATSGVENAYITYNGLNKQNFVVPVAFDLGYLDIPWTLAEATSSNDLMFLERSSSQVIATQFGGGDFRSAFGVRTATPRFWGGVYLTGPQSGAPHTGSNDGSAALLGRVGYQLLQTDDASLHIGANAGTLLNPRVNATVVGNSAVKTTLGNHSLLLSDRPELRIDPTVVLNTGAIPAKSGSVEGAEVAATWGNVYIQGEYFHYGVDQITTGTNPSDGAVNKVAPNLSFQGGYVEASYSFGGQRKYVPETGAYAGVIPDVPFSLSKGGFGAFEFAARYSTVGLNDHFTPGTAPHLSGGVNGGEQNAAEFGVNWYPNVNLKFMLDYLHVDISKLFKPTTNGTASVTPAGTKVDAVAARAQVAF